MIGPFLDHLRERFNLRSDARGTMLTGASMGGMGSLRLAFKYPEKFGAVAGMEPGTDPVMEWDEIRPKHRFWRSDALMEQAFGKPIDKDYYAANNPAWIVAHDAEKIRSSGLKIMLDAGDEDMYWLHEATQFLHEVLWDYKIRHEYHLYLGADHIGSSLAPRNAGRVRVSRSDTLRPGSRSTCRGGAKTACADEGGSGRGRPLRNRRAPDRERVRRPG